MYIKDNILDIMKENYLWNQPYQGKSSQASVQASGELKKTLGLVPALAIVVGMVIGSGVFFKPTAVFTATGAPGLGLIAGS